MAVRFGLVVLATIFGLALTSTKVVSAQEYLPAGEGIFIRQNPTIETKIDVSMAFWNVIVAPNMKSAPVVFPGAAMLEVRAGEGSVNITGQRRRLSYGDVVAVDAKTEVRFDTVDLERPLRIVATIFMSSGR